VPFFIVIRLGSVRSGKCRIFYDLCSHYPIVVLMGLGPVETEYDKFDQINGKKENYRIAAGNAVKALLDLDCTISQVDIDGCNDPQSIAEGVTLVQYKFDDLKKEKNKVLNIKLFNGTDESLSQYNRGVCLAQGQNIARRLANMPANLMTPTIFCEEAKLLASKINSVKVVVHDTEWAKSKGMGSFLSVTQGSDQPAKFLEVHYNNCPESKPLVYVGKGVCFDSGGISLKPPLDMNIMRGDMGGAANVLASIITLATLQAKVNVIGLIPLTENLINGHATKPGDVVKAMNGKTIQIDNTDAEGRLVLADALCYSKEFDPLAVIDIATLTGAMKVTFVDLAFGVWTTSDDLWELMLKNSIESGERVWRMPLFKQFTEFMTDCHLADINNLSNTGRMGSSNTAAAFLREFVECPVWMHVDIASVDYNKSDCGYLSKGMTGRPFRAMVSFIEDIFNKKNLN